VYTDGIVEAVGLDGQEFGRERLGRLLHSARDLEPNEFVQQLFRTISTPAPQDDLTAVLVQFD
ncbi:MAG: SpoIIE family protein phosphatase, partial [Bryobacteraceae bacterium]